MKIKRIVGYLLTSLIVIISAWSCIIFSLDFGYNRTNAWMLSFTFAEIFDFSVKDNITSIVLAKLLLTLASMRSKREMVKIEPSA